MKRLLIATRNPGKAREMAAVLADLPLEFVSLLDYPDAPEIEETGATFLENAVLKARAYAAYTGELTLADDSGLEVDALGGAPGVRSSRFAPTDPQRIAKLLDMMKDVPDGRRSARFRCAIAIAWPDGRVETCEDSIEGVIARSRRARTDSATTRSCTCPRWTNTWPSFCPTRRTPSPIAGRRWPGRRSYSAHLPQTMLSCSKCWKPSGGFIMIFHVVLEQAEDGWIVAECPALPGCVSQGKDEKEALDNIKEAITAWLWAEDQKAMSAITAKPGREPIVVAV